MTLVIIAAHDPNLVIGKDGKLPWHFKEDLIFFKKTTLGHSLLMGRIVFEEIGEKPLPDRENIVLTKKKSYPHVKTYSSISDALENLSDRDKVFIIGGGEIYRQTLAIADEMVITEIHQEFEGDTFFPDYRDDIDKIWREVWRENHEQYSFVKYKKIVS